MRRLDRLVAGTFTRLMVLTLLALPPLFMLGDLTDNVDDYLERDGVGIAEVLTGYLYKLPEWIQYSLPIAGLVAAVFTVHGMTVHREVVAAKAGGISFYRLFAPMLLGGILITGAGLLMADVVPVGNRMASDVLQNRPISQNFRSDFAYQTESGMLLSARRLSAGEGRLTHATLTDPADSAGDPDIHIEAESAVWTPTEGWRLNGAFLRKIYPGGREFASRARIMRVPGLTDLPTEMLDVPRDADELTLDQIERQIGISERAGAEPHELRVTAAQRLAIPVATLVIILFGAPLATTSKRGGAAFGIGIALGSTILYLMLARIWGAMGTAGLIDPLTAAWAPNAIFLTMALFFLARVRT